MIGYRKEVVFGNLRRSFPQKSEQEIKTIADGFYRHLCDVMVESFKTYTISKKEVKKRCPIINPEVFDQYLGNGKNLMVVTGHFGNWEWAALSTAIFSPYYMQAIYQPLSNPHFDKMMRKNRGKYGLTLVPANQVARYLKNKSAEAHGTVFLGDQAPGNIKKGIWLNFLNQETVVNNAMEKYAVITNSVIVFGEIRKIKRGFYEIHLHDLVVDASKAAPGEITHKYSTKLEELIRQQPQYWLWSHKRWKHKKPATN